ncbi:DUF1292 domain-containing protein [Paenibacillus antri]|uniref:DUF1292 domain-containing protein n=1 Tax=Paenibacillus antri TaxID=2582848 RepID=A0A5R9GEN0_9BACL|nr:DUF1292 domain-containing protein [Paenibacillus antri]TLS53599.1 DUF1292 domain-containing protein [Paenibacillus antri]
MSEYTLDNVVRANRLRETYGDDIVLFEDDDAEGERVHKIVLEFDLGDRSYVVLRPEDAAADEDDETSVFRVTPAGEGEFEIETIEDDEEWENVSELVDEMTVSFSKE